MTDTAALVERLRHRINEVYGGHGTVAEVPDELCQEAADALTAQAETIDRLRAALEFIAEHHDAGRHDGHREPYPAHSAEEMWLTACEALDEQSRADA